MSLWIRLEPVSRTYEAQFLEAAKRSTRLHRPWVKPPLDGDRFRAWVARLDGHTNISYFAMSASDDIVGVVNVSEIVRGVFLNAYLGYYALSPHEGRGYMTAALGGVVSKAFRELGLHRLEANIQPENEGSIALVRRLRFRKEGYSPHYLKIGGRWRDHERWAITREDWKGRAVNP